MNYGKEPLHSPTPDVVQRALLDQQAAALVAKTSIEVGTVIAEYASGKVKVFGELNPVDPRFAALTGRRTEIEMPSGLVIVHKNFGQTGRSKTQPEFNRIDVVRGNETSTLQVAIDPDPNVSIYNPYFIFRDGESRLAGLGYGQSIDLVLASQLLGDRSIQGDGSVPPAVIQWTRDRLT